MEIILLAIVIFLISRRKGNFITIPIEDLPMAENPKSKFQEDAFTEFYYRLVEKEDGSDKPQKAQKQEGESA